MADPSRTASVGDGLDGLKRVGLPASAHQRPYLSRRTLSHARSTDTLEAHLELLRCYYNFVRPHGALKFGRETRTPAMQAGLATRRLTLRDIFVSLRSLVSSLSDVLTLAHSRRMAAAAVMYMPVAA